MGVNPVTRDHTDKVYSKMAADVSTVERECKRMSDRNVWHLPHSTRLSKISRCQTVGHLVDSFLAGAGTMHGQEGCPLEVLLSG